jgi:hypothetical protein
VKTAIPITEEQLDQVEKAMAKMNVFTVRRAVTWLICHANRGRPHVEVYHHEAFNIARELFRRKALQELNPDEAESVVSAFLTKTPEEIEQLSRMSGL